MDAKISTLAARFSGSRETSVILDAALALWTLVTLWRPGLILIAFAISSIAAAGEKPIDVSVRQLGLNPKKFDGKRVSVRGYFDGTDIATLRASATTVRQSRDIFLNLRSGLARKLTALRFVKGRVRVTGTFQSYKPAPLNPKPIPGNPKYVTVTGNLGFGYAGFQYQITNITEFSLLPPSKR